MTTVGIRSNIPAQMGQDSIRASYEATVKAGRDLSEGETIHAASDNVAGLAISEGLRSQMSSLQAALMNTGQANSLLNVADNALQNIGNIISRQISLAAQATSGSLTAANRGFLDQEFQQLIKTHDQIAQTTAFNNVPLIDGSLFVPAKLVSDASSDGTSPLSASTADSVLAITTAFAHAADLNTSISINGAVFRVSDNATISTIGTPELNLDFENNATAATQAQELYNKISAVLQYSGNDQRVLDAKQHLSELSFEYVAGGTSIAMAAASAGSAANHMLVGANGTTTGQLTVGGRAASANTVPLASSSGGTMGHDGALGAGSGAALQASGTINISTAFGKTDDGLAINIGGAPIYLTQTSSMGTGNPIELQLDVQTYATANQQAQELKHIYDQVLQYGGTNSNVLSAKAAFEQLDIAVDGASIRVTSKLATTVGNTVLVTTPAAFVAGKANLDGLDLSGGASLTLTDLGRGTYVTNPFLTQGAIAGFQASGTINIGTAFDKTDDGTNLSINGVNIRISSTTGSSNVPAELNLEVQSVYTTASSQASGVVDLYNAVLNYTGSHPTVLAAKTKFQEVSLEAHGSQIRVSARDAGPEGNAIQIGMGTPTAGAANLNGVTLTGGTTVDLATPIRGTFVAEQARTLVAGSVGDTILVDINNSVNSLSGVDVRNLSNNPDFIGKVGGFKATKNASQLQNLVDLEMKVGDFTYKASAVNTNPTANTTIRLTSDEPDGGSFTIQMAANNGVPVSTATDVANFVDRLNSAFDSLTFYQKRDLSSYSAGGLVYPTGSSVPSGSLSNTAFTLTDDKFTNVLIENIDISAPVGGSLDSSFSFTIDGETYKSSAGIGSTLQANQDYAFVSTANSNHMLRMHIGETAIDVSTNDQASGLKTALEKAFGIKNGGSGLNFQVGVTAQNAIDVQIPSAFTKDIYTDEYGVHVPNLSIAGDTGRAAEVAGEVLNRAMSSVIASRATIGAYQSQFKFAAKNASSALVNFGAADADIRETDVPAATTEFASAQVKMQGGVAMLSQLNQLQRTILSLIQQL